MPVHPWSAAGSNALGSLKILGCVLAAAVVAHDVEVQLLTLDDGAHAGTLDGRDVDEHVLLAGVGRNEAETFGGIEEFNGTSSHDETFQST